MQHLFESCSLYFMKIKKEYIKRKRWTIPTRIKINKNSTNILNNYIYKTNNTHQLDNTQT